MIGLTFSGDDVVEWLGAEPAIAHVEIAAEEFSSRHTKYLAWLATLRPLVVRTASVSLGTPGPMARRLDAVTAVTAIAHPFAITCPLAFSRSDEIDLGQPVPFSLTTAALETVATNVGALHGATGASVLVENIATTLAVAGTIDVPEFLNRVCSMAPCRVLVDIPNLLIDARTRGLDAEGWIDRLEPGIVAAVRMGGTIDADGWTRAPHRPVEEEAWHLLYRLMRRARSELLLLEARVAADGRRRVAEDIARLRGLDAGGVPEAAAPATRARRASTLAAPERSSPMRAGDRTSGAAATVVSLARDAAVPVTADVLPIAADTALFVLEDAGVFFSESRQEVYLFNTAATLVWCLLEDGLGLDAIAGVYHESFGVTRDEAMANVTSIVHQWFGFGYLLSAPAAGVPSIPLTTALARLLTSATLRARFTADPAALAATLAVAGDDREALLALDAIELERVAGRIAQARAAARQQAAGPGRTPARDATSVALDGRLLAAAARARAAAAPLAAPGHYRLLTTTFAIRCGMPAMTALVHQALRHLEVPAAAADVSLDVLPAGDEQWLVCDAALPVRPPLPTTGVVPMIKQLLRERCINRHDFLIKIHAGVVSLGDACAIFPATAGSGKTTLTAGMIHAGATYFSDEVALLEHGTLHVRPVPLALTVKDGSVEPLVSRFPTLPTLAAHEREDHQQVRYLPPPAASLGADRPLPVRWIVFPRYVPGGGTALLTLDRPTGLRRLLDEALVLPELLDRQKVEALVGWMRGVECYELPNASLDEAVRLVRGLAAAGARIVAPGVD